MDETLVVRELATLPTPALLPGLVGMGVAAWRKRKEGLLSNSAFCTIKASASPPASPNDRTPPHSITPNPHKPPAASDSP
ncbi:MAG: PTPA-CTERM sorting domain-containing protein [Alkalinema sp. RU_4_3]|nr:PTPA-CTERM sorting domain-containing protein [Alkalinema sp. RU_4_3]